MKTRKLYLLTEAHQDILRARSFYEKQEKGLGRYFSRMALAELESLTFFAGIHQQKVGYYRMLLKHFPYSAYYQITDSQVQIVAVLDMRQNPKHVLRLLRQRKQPDSL